MQFRKLPGIFALVVLATFTAGCSSEPEQTPEEAKREAEVKARRKAAAEAPKKPLFREPTAEQKRSTPAPSGAPSSEQRLEDALSYLDDVEGVAWREIDGNDLYVGVTDKYDLRAMIAAAAFLGNKATDFGFHAWAVDANRARRGWRPGEAGYICSATVRHSKHEKNDCPR